MYALSKSLTETQDRPHDSDDDQRQLMSSHYVLQRTPYTYCVLTGDQDSPISLLYQFMVSWRKQKVNRELLDEKR